MTTNKHEGDVSIGKFNIVAADVYARGLVDGLNDEKLKQRGMVAAKIGRSVK
jgi:hypothetical protein